MILTESSKAYFTWEEVLKKARYLERKNTFYSNSFAFICTKVKICIATASLTHHWSHHSIHPQYKCPGVFSCCK